MIRIALAAAGLLATIGATPAQAAKETDRRLEAALACAGIVGDAQRLACYDKAIATLKAAVQSGELGTRDATGDPTSLEGIIKTSGVRGYNRYWVHLDNGDRWEIIARDRDVEPRRGEKVKFERSAIGNYFFEEPGYPPRRATFLGRTVKK